MTNEVRRLPKKTIIIISILFILGILVFFGLKIGKEAKISEILVSLGHTNIKEVKVINKLSVEDKKTRYKSTVYKVMFKDLDLKQTCSGFLHRGRDNTYTKDFNCK